MEFSADQLQANLCKTTLACFQFDSSHAFGSRWDRRRTCGASLIISNIAAGPLKQVSNLKISQLTFVKKKKKNKRRSSNKAKAIAQ